MSSDDKPYVGDVGTAIEIDMQEDLTSWGNLKFYVKKPKIGGGTEEVVVSAERKATPDNSIMRCIVEEQPNPTGLVFDVQGKYFIQPYGEVGGWKGKGDTISFMVYPKFK